MADESAELQMDYVMEKHLERERHKIKFMSAEAYIENWQEMYPAVYAQKAILKKISGDEDVVVKLLYLLKSLGIYEKRGVESTREIDGCGKFLLSKKNELNGFRDCLTSGDRGDAKLFKMYWRYDKVIDQVYGEIALDYNNWDLAWDFRQEVERAVDRDLRYIDVEPIFIMLPDDEEFIKRVYDEYFNLLREEPQEFFV